MNIWIYYDAQGDMYATTKMSKVKPYSLILS